MSNKDEIIAKLHGKIDEYSTDIDALIDKVETKKSEKNMEYHQEINDLRIKREELKEKIDSLKTAGEESFQDIKTGIENAGNALGDAVRSAKERFF